MINNKKKVFVGLIGNYRSFERTKDSLYNDLIDFNKDEFEFDIYINTEYESKYIHKKHSTNFINKYNYKKEELDILFKKCYKNNLKNITYETLERININNQPIFRRIKSLIKKNNMNSYDLFVFLRIDTIFLEKLNLSTYFKKIDNDTVNVICRDVIFKNRCDHNRDWDFGIISKNHNNILKYVSFDYEIIPNITYKELKKVSEKINLKGNIFRNKISFINEKEKYVFCIRNVSFFHNISPIFFEDTFFMKIIR